MKTNSLNTEPQEERSNSMISQMLLRQQYKDEIYNYRPPWILRWGVTVFFLFIVTVIMVSSFIKYPDTVTGSAEIYTINPPVNLVATISGKLDSMFVREGQMVEKDQNILLLESTVRWYDIMLLEQKLSFIDSLLIQKDDTSPLQTRLFKDQLILGEIQGHYSELKTSYNDLCDYQHLANNFEKLTGLKRQLHYQKDYILQLNKKRELLLQKVELANKNLLRDKQLFSNEVIAEQKYDQSRLSNDLLLKEELLNLDLNLTTALSKQESLALDIKNFVVQNKIEDHQLWLRLEKSVQMIKTRISDWKKRTVISSPIKGVVSFNQYWNEYQFVSSGDVVASIVPKDSTSVIARVRIPIENSGKVRKGQRVNIKLANYPFQEFGMLIGTMGELSQVPAEIQPSEYYYSSNVLLNNNAITSYGNELPRVQQLIGTAEIMTDDLSLLMRFFSPLRAIIDERILNDS
ncbi:HlyD family efflux transporter periplasmic adaptor subunit [Fulvivirga sp. M361]|uniref:HlyD family secretion protein n=1 Tax=Fulvivirga sp. M361 TaxID=2594266 RepID=UPI00117ACE70|nr:HlyD family secretion protein [Fulvivirga sp. M361]TRX45892.1 HlyD family efflux transporter periplasmic adaptor subunit [Fulvivirga sp. M361]